MNDRLEKIIKNTRGTFECLLDFGIRSTETDLIALREGFETIVSALESARAEIDRWKARVERCERCYGDLCGGRIGAIYPAPESEAKMGMSDG